MFTLTTVRSPYRALAMLVSIAVLTWSVGYYAVSSAQAANLVELSNTLTDSSPGAESGHEIRFIVPEGSDIDGEITIVFPPEFTVGTINGSNTSVVFSLAGTAGTPGSSGNTITIPTAEAVEDEVVTITIDEGVIENPGDGDQGSYRITVTTETSDGTDIGNTHVVIIDTVLVTARVETTFEFVIEGVDEAIAPTGLELTTGSTTATSVPFGTLEAGEEYFLAQTLLVTTNARNGYIVTVEQDGPLRSTTGAEISSFIDGQDTDLPAAPWNEPGEDVLDRDTWGHWGMTSNDTTLGTLHAGLALEGNYFGVTTSPRIVMAHDGSADGDTQDIGLATVGYKIEITALQEAAEDYSTTLTYIATPTF